MAYGAQLTFICQPARLRNNLDGSGATTSISNPFTLRAREIDRMNSIKKYLNSNCKVGATKTSARFDMGHGYPLDAPFHYILNHQGDDH